MQLVIISGRSGSGKTVALRALEDLGFYCVDNLPLVLLPILVNTLNQARKVAVSIDSRNPFKGKEEVNETLDFLPQKIKAQIIFVDAADDILVRRYSDTRRIHPLAGTETSLVGAIELERQVLAPLQEKADYYVDTSQLSVHELSDEIRRIILGDVDKQLIITVLSFGFKHGIPTDADTVFDARILPNPHWEPLLRPLTGLDEPVQHFFAKEELVTKFTSQIESFIETWLPYFKRNNRSYLTIAIGCTGGQHRSVYIADVLGQRLKQLDPHVKVRHRELERKKQEQPTHSVNKDNTHAPT